MQRGGCHRLRTRPAAEWDGRGSPRPPGELGWSQRQIAKRADLTQPGIARFEAGGTTPPCRRWNAWPPRSA